MYLLACQIVAVKGQNVTNVQIPSRPAFQGITGTDANRSEGPSHRHIGYAVHRYSMLHAKVLAETHHTAVFCQESLADSAPGISRRSGVPTRPTFSSDEMLSTSEDESTISSTSSVG